MENLNLKNIYKLVLLDKWKILIVFILSSIFAILYSLSLPNVYTSRVVVSSNINESGAAGLSGSLGGLASMAGISIGGGEMSPEVVKEALSSNSFLGKFAIENDLVEILFAATHYNYEIDKYQFDESIFKEKGDVWVREVTYPKSKKPSTEEVAAKFKENLAFSFDRKTKLITITFSSLSPKLSKQVLDSLVNSFNTYMKEKDQLDSQNTIEYLKRKLSLETVSEVRLALQQLFEEQLKQLAFSETKAEYALKVLDKPLIPFNKSAPKRAIICLMISGLATSFFTMLFLSVRIYRQDKIKVD